MECPSCKTNHLLWNFSENIFRCTHCGNYIRFADVQLTATLGSLWSVIFAENEKGQKVYLVMKEDKYLGVLTDLLAGVVYFEGAKVDDQMEDNALTLLEALNAAFGVYNLQDGHRVITFVPKTA